MLTSPKLIAPLQIGLGMEPIVPECRPNHNHRTSEHVYRAPSGAVRAVCAPSAPSPTRSPARAARRSPHTELRLAVGPTNVPPPALRAPLPAWHATGSSSPSGGARSSEPSGDEAEALAADHAALTRIAALVLGGGGPVRTELA